jgi:hypothetical protein
MVSKVLKLNEVITDKPQQYIVIDRTKYAEAELQDKMNYFYDHFYVLSNQSTETQLVFELDRVSYMNARKRDKSAMKRVVQEFEDAKDGKEFTQEMKMKVGENVPQMMQMTFKDKK